MENIEAPKELYIRRGKWEQELNKFIRARSGEGSQSSNDSKSSNEGTTERFLILGGVGGSGKTLLKENIEAFCSSSDGNSVPILINIDVNSDDSRFISREPLHFLWPKVLLEASETIKDRLPKETFINRVKTYFKGQSQPFRGFRYLHNTYISQKDSIALNHNIFAGSAVVLFIVACFAFVLEQFSTLSIFSLIGAGIGAFVGHKPIKYWLFNLRFKIYKSLNGLRFNEKEFKDGGDFEKEERYSSDASLFTKPSILTGVFKAELDLLLCTQKIQPTILFTFDVNDLKGKLSQELVEFCELLTKSSSPSAKDTSLTRYDEAVKVLLVSKHRQKVSAALSQSEYFIDKRNYPRLLDVKSLDEKEAKLLVQAKLNSFIKEQNLVGSATIAKEVARYLNYRDDEWNKKKRAARAMNENELTTQLKIIESLADVLVNGVYHITSRLAISVNNRCDAFCRLYGVQAPTALPELFGATDESKSWGNLGNIISDRINSRLNEPFERLFEGLDNPDILKRSIALIYCLKNVTKRDWQRIYDSELESFDNLKSRKYLVSYTTINSETEVLSLQRQVHELIATHPEHCRIAEQSILSFYRSLTGIHNIQESEVELRSSQISILIKAIYCLSVPAQIQKLNSLDWPLNEFTHILKLSYRAYLSSQNDGEVKQSILDAVFNCIMNFFSDSSPDADDYWSQVSHDPEWQEPLIAMFAFTKFDYEKWSTHLLELNSVSQLVRLQVNTIKIFRKSPEQVELNSTNGGYYAKKLEGISSNNDTLILFHNWAHNLLLQHQKLQDTQENQSDEENKLPAQSELQSSLESLYQVRHNLNFDDLLSKYQQITHQLKSAVLDENQHLSCVYVHRKIASSLLSRSERQVPEDMDKLDSEVLTPFFDLTAHIRACLKESKLKVQLTWYEFRTLLYYLDRLALEGVDIITLKYYQQWEESLSTTLEQSNLLEQRYIEKLIKTLKEKEFTRVRRNPSTIYLNQIELPISSSTPWSSINYSTASNLSILKESIGSDKESELLVSKFSQFLAKAADFAKNENVREETAINRKMRLAFSGLAISNDTKHKIMPETVTQLRELYAKTLIEHLKQRAIRSNAEGIFKSKLNNQRAVESQIKKFCEFKTKENTSILRQALELISRFNPTRSELRTGDFLVCRVHKIDKNNKVEFKAINSDIKPTVTKGLLPNTLYNFAFPDNEKEFKDTDDKADYWTGELILLQALNQSQAHEGDHNNNDSVAFTAKGAEYIGNCLHLFFPTARSWANTNPIQARVSKDTELTNFFHDVDDNDEGSDEAATTIVWNGELWMGASNSWATLRLNPSYMAMFLANSGTLHKELTKLLGLRRITVFEKSRVSNFQSAQMAERKEIKHFTNNSYQYLRVFFGENDEVLFVLHEEPKENEGSLASDISQVSDGSDGFEGFNDPRKMRTFCSMFTKIFDVPIEVQRTRLPKLN
ncbi:hypothetical protein [Idiomarina ramblicola]|uniref:Uncharacterized protein n=1 Tax=Idiomarina ramblicola TaxID=263724 RepID=A0A432Z063_9GAMM|nr:hypothetical protein [Idiomarina ramblicola]RUO69588.1 hypothetical protein CWI78_06600 [Idiomarina ramblicola]